MSPQFSAAGTLAKSSIGRTGTGKIQDRGAGRSEFELKDGA